MWCMRISTCAIKMYLLVIKLLLGSYCTVILTIVPNFLTGKLLNMSWLADLAGKAESLLEKVDQSAANALQVEKGVGSEPVASTKQFTRDNPTTTPTYVHHTDSTPSTRSHVATNINSNGNWS